MLKYIIKLKNKSNYSLDKDQEKKEINYERIFKWYERRS